MILALFRREFKVLIMGFSCGRLHPWHIRWSYQRGIILSFNPGYEEISCCLTEQFFICEFKYKYFLNFINAIKLKMSIKAKYPFQDCLALELLVSKYSCIFFKIL